MSVLASDIVDSLEFKSYSLKLVNLSQCFGPINVIHIKKAQFNANSA